MRTRGFQRGVQPCATSSRLHHLDMIDEAPSQGVHPVLLFTARDAITTLFIAITTLGLRERRRDRENALCP